MRRVQKQRSKWRGVSASVEGIELPSASGKASCLRGVHDLLARIDEMILSS